MTNKPVNRTGVSSIGHRTALGLAAVISVVCLMLLTSGMVQADESRYWLLEEESQQIGQSCAEGKGCTTHFSYIVRGFPRGSEGMVKPLISLLVPMDEEEADVPVFCPPGNGSARLGFDPESIPPAHKLAALRGIDTVGLDLRKVKAPPGADAGFGDILHESFVAKLQAAGIRVVTPEEVQTVPGRPTLNIYFSVFEGQGDCDYRYSIFASLSQTALLTRDLQTKVVVGVWSLSIKAPVTNARGTELANLLSVADALVADLQEANGR